MRNKLFFKTQVQKLRKLGKTYSEIKNILGKKFADSTLSYWCRTIKLKNKHVDRINRIIKKNRDHARAKAVKVNRERRKQYLTKIENENAHLALEIDNTKVGKIILGSLYLAEGSKGRRGSLTFGNSDPLIIRLFLYLFRKNFVIDEEKFRCTILCRADTPIKKALSFWSEITRIPLKQFYGSRIDPRTKGKPTRKKNYLGVCRIDYFSAELYNQLTIIGKTICNSISVRGH